MDQVRSIMDNGKAVRQQGTEQELFQNNDDVKCPETEYDAFKEWQQFLKSTYYGTVVPTGYLEVDRHQNDPRFCIETFVHPLEKEARIAVLFKQFNAFKGSSNHNQLDEFYHTLAHNTMETEIWRGILNFRQFDATYMNAVDQLHRVGFSPTNIAATSWQPVFGPRFVRPERTSSRLMRAPSHTLHSSVSSDQECGNSFSFGYLNASDESLANDYPDNPPPSRASFASMSSASEFSETAHRERGFSAAVSMSIITNCPALINHDHECTAPSDVLPSLPARNLIPTPAATGLNYTGPNPSAALNQLLNDHVNAPVVPEEMALESASQKRCNREYRIILAAVLVVFVGLSIAALIAGIVVASKRKCFRGCF